MAYLKNKLLSEIAESDDLYFLQNGWSGNDLSFWRINGAGYTTNIEDAQQFTKAEALSQHKVRAEDIPWNAYQVVFYSSLTCNSEKIPSKFKVTE